MLTQRSLVDQLDDDLRSAASGETLVTPPGQTDNDATGRRFALILYDTSFSELGRVPSGIASSPDPFPDIPGGDPRTLPMNTVVQLSSTDGGLAYRAIRVRGQLGPQPVVAVFAAPEDGIDASVAVLTRTLAIVGLVVLALILIIGWFIIRRDLRPLESITTTAERISEGDLSQRVGVPDDGSEIGRLGHAFDTMLDQIQGLFDSQHAALVAKDRSESQLRRFVADASHELRTPLTAVRGYSELYRAGGLSDREDMDQAMARIGSESRRMAALVEDMLLLARLDQGRPLRHDPVPLSELVNDALLDLRAVDPERPVEANVESNVVVSGDEDRLRQVIGNLVTNVRVHTPPDTPIEVGLSARNGYSTLKVADHGPGIDPTHVEHIFDRFYRADSARTRDRGGSGLGLSIAASVATAHGGEISYSNTPGGGATFTLTLPRDGKPEAVEDELQDDTDEESEPQTTDDGPSE
ncbi:MAG TPA: HAMP domain-containing sensor histidine kinase [Candidatus Limnocylindrales bacterium]